MPTRRRKSFGPGRHFRMQPNAALKIHLSLSLKSVLDQFQTFLITERGEISIKGKGMMKTFWLAGEKTPATRYRVTPELLE